MANTEREDTKGHPKVDHREASGRTGNRLQAVVRAGGLYYSALYATRWMLRQLADGTSAAAVRLGVWLAQANPVQLANSGGAFRWLVSARRYVLQTALRAPKRQSSSKMLMTIRQRLEHVQSPDPRALSE